MFHNLCDLLLGGFPQRLLSSSVLRSTKMLTAEEIGVWDRLIEQSRDLGLARKFYPKAGRPERVKEVFSSAVRYLAQYDVLLQEKFEQGAFRPELTDDEVRHIAADSLRDAVKNGYLGEVFRKLDFPVFGASGISEQELGSLVNRLLRDGAQGYSPGKDPRRFAQGLVDFPVNHECPEEVAFAYAVLMIQDTRDLSSRDWQEMWLH